MTMKRLFAAALALCLTASALCGCATEEPAETTGAAQTGREEETIYLLTMLEQKNDQGEVLSRTTYTYDDRGLVLTKEMDWNNLTVWNDELGFYEYQSLPCDGVVDVQNVIAYDEYGNPVRDFYNNGLGTRYEYTYDTDGKITAFVSISSDQTIDVTVEYDASGNVKVFTFERGVDTEPMLNCEFKYNDAGRITHITNYGQDWVMPCQFEFDAEGKLICCERIMENPIMNESIQFTYDEAGRVLTEDGFIGENSYQYEDDMLVAINNERLIIQKQDGGVLTVQYGDVVLTYTPLVLDKQEAEMARYRWNLQFGRRFALQPNTGYPLCLNHPMYALDTVLLLPKEIF